MHVLTSLFARLLCELSIDDYIFESTPAPPDWGSYGARTGTDYVELGTIRVLNSANIWKRSKYYIILILKNVKVKNRIPKYFHNLTYRGQRV